MKRLSLLCLGLLACGAASADHWNGGRTVPIHRLTPLDADGEKIDFIEPLPRPISQARTCGQCHDVAAMKGGSHFRTGLDTNEAPVRASYEPWFLADDAKGTVRALSLTGAEGTFSPAACGMSAFAFTKTFGRAFPGGGVGADPRTTGEVVGDKARWFVTGPLEANCLACHLQTPYDSSEWARQVARENFAGAATAASGLGAVEGMNSRMDATWNGERRENPDDHLFKVPEKVIYDAKAFDYKGRCLFNVGKPKNENCLACHAVSRKGVPNHDLARDVHLQRGMKCIDCHVNGMDHRVRTKGCAECHTKPHGNGPPPNHAGIPVVHFQKLSCTVCHAGSVPAGSHGVVRTARANRIGIYGRAQWDTDLPYILEPLFVRNAKTGKIEPHRLTWTQDEKGRWYPLSWKFTHDIRPARQALGSAPERCAACHAPDSPFLFATLKAEGPLAGKGIPAVSQAEVLGIDAAYHTFFAWTFALRPFFKVFLWTVFVILCVIAAAAAGVVLARLWKATTPVLATRLGKVFRALVDLALACSVAYLAASGLVGWCCRGMTSWWIVGHMVAGGAFAAALVCRAALVGPRPERSGLVLALWGLWILLAAGVVFSAVMPMMTVFAFKGQMFLLWMHRLTAVAFLAVSAALCAATRRRR